MPKKPFFKDTRQGKALGRPQDRQPRRERPRELLPEPLASEESRPGQKPRASTKAGKASVKPGDASVKRKAASTSRPQLAISHTHWGDVAEWYDSLVGDEGSTYHRQVIIPGVMRLLELKKLDTQTPKVLDLACGQGVLCRRLAEQGCEVTGVDAALPLIEAAERRNRQDRLPITYTVADVTELLDEGGNPACGLEAEAYDAATVILAIQNITPLSPVWRACHRLLKPNGRLVVVLMHPCFRVPKNSDWLWDEASFTQLRVIRQYLSSADIEIQTHPGHAAHGVDQSSTIHFHRPLQAYINTMGNAGLYIDQIQEWTSHKSDQAGPKKEALDRARNEFPLFLALRARKL